MSDKIEGTMSLEGLIEGQMPPFPDAQAKLEKWAAGFAGGAVRMSVQIDGMHFSALPANEPVQVKDVTKGVEGRDPADVVADSLSDLLRYFPPLERGQVFSTLRSVAYRHNLQVQTVYAVGPDGRAATRQQTLPCETVAAEAPLSRKEIIKQGVIGVVVAAAVVAISSIWVPYGSIWRQMTARTEGVKVPVEAGTFEPYFAVKVTGIDRRTGMLQVEVTRTKAFPRDEGALDALYASPPEVLVAGVAATAPASAPATGAASAPATGSAGTASAPASAPASGPAVGKVPASLVKRRVAVESLAKGVVVLEFWDAGGYVLGQTGLRVTPLQQYEVLKTEVPAPVVGGRAVVPAGVRVLPG